MCASLGIVCLLTATVLYVYTYSVSLLLPSRHTGRTRRTAARQINFTASILRADISEISRLAPTRSVRLVIRAPILGRDFRRGSLLSTQKANM